MAVVQDTFDDLADGDGWPSRTFGWNGGGTNTIQGGRARAVVGSGGWTAGYLTGGNQADAELTFDAYFPNITNNVATRLELRIGGGGSGFDVLVAPTQGNIYLRQRAATAQILDQFAYSFTADVGVRVKVRFEVDSLKVKAWPTGDSEPATWDIDVTNSTSNTSGLWQFTTTGDSVVGGGGAAPGTYVEYDNIYYEYPPPEEGDPPPPDTQKAETLTDDFTAGTVDAGNWPNAFGSLAIDNGRLRIEPESAGSSDYNGLISAELDYDLTDSYVFFRPWPPATSVEATREVQMSFYTDDDNRVQFIWSEGTLIMRQRVGGVNSDTSVAYDPTVHKYWRLREASGTLYWDTSEDGSTWINRRSLAHAMTLTAGTISFIAGHFSAADPADWVVYFDDVNTVGPATELNVVKVWDGSAWAEGVVKVWTGSAWQEGVVKVWNGSAWVSS